jgi:hypothetical protein
MLNADWLRSLGGGRGKWRPKALSGYQIVHVSSLSTWQYYERREAGYPKPERNISVWTGSIYVSIPSQATVPHLVK